MTTKRLAELANQLRDEIAERYPSLLTIIIVAEPGPVESLFASSTNTESTKDASMICNEVARQWELKLIQFE